MYFIQIQKSIYITTQQTIVVIHQQKNQRVKHFQNSILENLTFGNNIFDICILMTTESKLRWTLRLFYEVK